MLNNLSLPHVGPTSNDRNGVPLSAGMLVRHVTSDSEATVLRVTEYGDVTILGTAPRTYVPLTTRGVFLEVL